MISGKLSACANSGYQSPWLLKVRVWG